VPRILRQFNLHRREFDPKALRNDTDPEPKVPPVPRYPGLHEEAAPRWAALMTRARADDKDLVVPAAERARYEASFARFASVFPDVFYVSERGRYFPDDSDDKGRFLSAGYHNVMGFWRDDVPLMELVLDEKGQKTLNRLWDEFDFIADHTARTWAQFYFNQSGAVDGKGAEAGRLRPTDKAIDDPDVIFGLRNDYRAKAAADPANDPIAVEAVEYHFAWINSTLRRVQQMRLDAEPRHLDAVLRFAARAYRRPLTQVERDGLLTYYRSIRKQDGLSHEDAIRDLIVSVCPPEFAESLAADVERLRFHGNYLDAKTTYNDNVKICTPITSDSSGSLYFGFYIAGDTPIGSADTYSVTQRARAPGSATCKSTPPTRWRGSSITGLASSTATATTTGRRRLARPEMRER